MEEGRIGGSIDLALPVSNRAAAWQSRCATATQLRGAVPWATPPSAGPTGDDACGEKEEDASVTCGAARGTGVADLRPPAPDRPLHCVVGQDGPRARTSYRSTYGCTQDADVDVSVVLVAVGDEASCVRIRGVGVGSVGGVVSVVVASLSKASFCSIYSRLFGTPTRDAPYLEHRHSRSHAWPWADGLRYVLDQRIRMLQSIWSWFFHRRVHGTSSIYRRP